MKKFRVQISHTEYGNIEIEAKNEQEAEKLALENENIDSAGWGNDETDVIDVEEIKN